MMKTKDLLILLTFFFCTSCGNKNEIDSNSSAFYENLIRTKVEIMNMERPKDSYNYPVYPGMKEWELLSTGQEMLKACQVPLDKLKNMSTQAVIQAIWEHPLLVDVFHRYQYQLDFESMFILNNAYNELCKRTDAGTSLLERLKVVNPLVSGAKYEFDLLELLMAQDIFISQLSETNKKTAIEYAINKDDLRREDTRFTNAPERILTWLLAGKVMYKAGYSPFLEEVNQSTELKLFLTSNSYVYMKEIYGDTPQVVAEYASRFIANKND